MYNEVRAGDLKMLPLHRVTSVLMYLDYVVLMKDFYNSVLHRQKRLKRLVSPTSNIKHLFCHAVLYILIEF